MKTIKFSYGANLCIETNEGFEREVEIGPHQYRCRYLQDHRGNVSNMFMERNETRPGNPELWMLDPRLPDEVYSAILEQIEHEDAQEQRRIVAMYDEERV